MLNRAILGHAIDTFTGGIEFSRQALALFVKSIRKTSKRLVDVGDSALEQNFNRRPLRVGPETRVPKMTSALEKLVEITIDDELREAGNEVTPSRQGRNRGR